jgi:hypothetical protein
MYTSLLSSRQEQKPRKLDFCKATLAAEAEKRLRGIA